MLYVMYVECYNTMLGIISIIIAFYLTSLCINILTNIIIASFNIKYLKVFINRERNLRLIGIISVYSAR